jgi:hypothetical protein
VLFALIVGVLIYVNEPSASFINYVANKSVTLSGVAGERPRTDLAAAGRGKLGQLLRRRPAARQPSLASPGR